MTPGELFRLAYPEVGQPLRPAAAGLLGIEGRPPDEGFVAQVCAALIQLLSASGAVSQRQSTAEPTSEEPAQSAPSSEPAAK
jgi:hypothetical protein